MSLAYQARREETLWLKVFRQDALSANNGRCCYCGDRINSKTATADHKHPRIKGGSTTRENIAASCQPCNLTKGSMSVTAFKKWIRNPQPGDGIYIHLAHFRWRLWKATQRACARIEKVCK